MSNTLEQFTEFLVNEKKARANTVDSYIRDASAFLAYSGVEPARVCEVSPENVREYLDGMLSAGRSQASVRRAKASLRCFFDFASKVDEPQSNPAEQVTLSPYKKKLPEVLSIAEVERLLAMPNIDGPKGLRDKCMLDLLYATGLKVSELVALDIADVSTLGGYVRCKNAKGCRFIPIHEQAAGRLGEYLKSRGHASGASALFLNTRGGRMTRQGFWKILKQYADKAEIAKTITPQTLRYTLALHLYENGADKRDIQSILGYADISSLQLCINVFKGDLQENYRKYHPKSTKSKLSP